MESAGFFFGELRRYRGLIHFQTSWFIIEFREMVSVHSAAVTISNRLASGRAVCD
jgi:hypothetical protein